MKVVLDYIVSNIFIVNDCSACLGTHLLNVDRLNIKRLNVECYPTSNAINAEYGNEETTQRRRQLPNIEKLDVGSELRMDQRRKILKQCIWI